MKFTHTIILFLYCTIILSQQLCNSFHGPGALGKANVYATLEGIQSIYGNPANLQGDFNWAANVSVQNQFEIPEFLIFQFGFLYDNKQLGTFGLSVIQLGVTAYKEQQFSLAYSRLLTKKLHAGIRFDWLHTRADSYGSANTVTFDLGIHYGIMSKLDIGLHIYNPFQQKLDGAGILPSFMTLGMRYLLEPHIHCFFEVEKNLYYPPRIKVAFQYFLDKIIHASIGIYTSARSANITLGFGYKPWNRARMDFGMAYNQYLGISSAIGFDYVQ